MFLHSAFLDVMHLARTRIKIERFFFFFFLLCGFSLIQECSHNDCYLKKLSNFFNRILITLFRQLIYHKTYVTVQGLENLFRYLKNC